MDLKKAALDALEAARKKELEKGELILFMLGVRNNTIILL